MEYEIEVFIWQRVQLQTGNIFRNSAKKKISLGMNQNYKDLILLHCASQGLKLCFCDDANSAILICEMLFKLK